MYNTPFTNNLRYYLFTKPLITFQMTILIFWVQFQNPRETGASFLTVGVFKCGIAHRRSVAVLCMLYKIRCNPMYFLHCALPVPSMPARVTRGIVIAHRYTYYAPPRCRTSKYNTTFIPLSVSLLSDLSDPVFDGVWLAGFKSRANAILLA